MSTLRAQKLLRNNVTIPTIPEIVTRIQKLVDDPEAGTKEMGALVAQDAPLAAKVLRIANSAYYGLHEPCVSTEQASAILGARVLRNVVTQAAVMNQYQHLRKYSDFDFDEMWRHTVATGHVCASLAKQCKVPLALTPDEFYVCGLLHDIGQIVMLDSLGEEYLDILRESKQQKRPIQLLEQSVLGYDHTDVGALIARRWSLPDPIINAIQYHHGPREAVESDPVVSLVANANLLVNRVSALSLESAELVFDDDTCDLLGLSTIDKSEIVRITQEAISGATV